MSCTILSERVLCALVSVAACVQHYGCCHNVGSGFAFRVGFQSNSASARRLHFHLLLLPELPPPRGYRDLQLVELRLLCMLPELPPPVGVSGFTACALSLDETPSTSRRGRQL